MNNEEKLKKAEDNLLKATLAITVARDEVKASKSVVQFFEDVEKEFRKEKEKISKETS